VPGIEGDLADVRDERVPFANADRACRQALQPVLHLTHEAGLAGAPVTEQREGKRRLRRDRTQHGRDRVHVAAHIERVLGGVEVTDHIGQPLPLTKPLWHKRVVPGRAHRAVAGRTLRHGEIGVAQEHVEAETVRQCDGNRGHLRHTADEEDLVHRRPEGLRGRHGSPGDVDDPIEQIRGQLPEPFPRHLDPSCGTGETDGQLASGRMAQRLLQILGHRPEVLRERVVVGIQAGVLLDEAGEEVVDKPAVPVRTAKPGVAVRAHHMDVVAVDP
jgi:hypothetical protein